MSLDIPDAIAKEHKALHERMLAAKKVGGKTGEAAKRAAKVFHPHFLAEEEFALPPVMMLQQIANGNVTPQMRHIIPLSEHLKRDMPRMLRAHDEIRAAMDELEQAAIAEQKHLIAEFARDVKDHARHEEEVVYPAAIIVGEYLKLRFAQERNALSEEATHGAAVPSSAARRSRFNIF